MIREHYSNYKTVIISKGNNDIENMIRLNFTDGTTLYIKRSINILINSQLLETSGILFKKYILPILNDSYIEYSNDGKNELYYLIKDLKKYNININFTKIEDISNKFGLTTLINNVKEYIEDKERKCCGLYFIGKLKVFYDLFDKFIILENELNNTKYKIENFMDLLDLEINTLIKINFNNNNIVYEFFYWIDKVVIKGKDNEFIDYLINLIPNDKINSKIKFVINIIIDKYYKGNKEDKRKIKKKFGYLVV